MTLTETRPAPTSASTAPSPVERGPLAWIATGDHKRLGLLFAVGGVLSLIAACAVAFLYQLPAVAGMATAFTAPSSRLSSAATAAAFVVGIPALWIGLATYVLPLQIGGHRVALPRLHNLALWLFGGGGVLIAIAHLADWPHLTSLASSVPPVAIKGQHASHATELLIAGMAIVCIGTLFAAISLLVTVTNRRAEGLPLRYMPAFAWSVFGTAVTLVAATPVVLAGLVLLYFDQHSGSTLFASPPGALVWAHELWLLGRPEALLFAGAGIGISCEIVAATLRRPLVPWPVVRAVVVAAPLVTLLLWVGGRSVLSSPFAPTATILAFIVLAPAGLAVLTWLASVRGSKPRVLPAVLLVVAHLVPVALAGAMVAVGAITKIEGYPATDNYRNGQLVLLTFGVPVIDLAAGIVYWGPKLRGRVATLATAGAPALLLVGGVLLFAIPGYAIGLGASASVTVVGAIGAAATALGLLTLLPFLVGNAGDAPDDPHEGLTLEWATASPPVTHNFEVIPDVRSAHPLYDARVSAGAGAGAGAGEALAEGDA